MKVLTFKWQDTPIINDLNSLILGYFDGMHIGHQKLIRHAVSNSDKKVGLLTFTHSYYGFKNGYEENLQNPKNRINQLDSIGVDYLFLIDVDESFFNLTSSEFIDNILKKLNPKVLFFGEDYSFGKGKNGSIEELSKSFKYVVFPFVKYEGKKVSSSAIKEMIKNGDIETANKLLFMDNYEIEGTVIKGFENGKKIGFPTLNVKPNFNYLLPKNGVYKVNLFCSGKIYNSICNVGIHPTIDKLANPVIEVHAINEDLGDCYGKTVYVDFIKFIREEKKFNSLDELVDQIKQDIKKC